MRPCEESALRFSLNDKRTNLFNLNSSQNYYYPFPFLKFWNTYNSTMLRRGFKVYLNSPLFDPKIFYDHEKELLGKVLTIQELKAYRHAFENRIEDFHTPERKAFREKFSSMLQTAIETNDPYPIYLAKNRLPLNRIPFLKRFINWIRFVSPREYHNTLYNILTGYGYHSPPSELKIPRGCYFNPYVRNMVTNVPPFLFDNMLQYDDGTGASTPQMAYDLSLFLGFLKYGKRPDYKIELVALAGFSLLALGWLSHYRRCQRINALSFRFEAYGLRTGGFRRFRERFVNKKKLDA